jgi:hypothetical protein
MRKGRKVHGQESWTRGTVAMLHWSTTPALMVLGSTGRLAPDHQTHFARSGKAIRALEAFQRLFHFGPGGILPFLGKIGDQSLVEGEPLAASPFGEAIPCTREESAK